MRRLCLFSLLVFHSTVFAQTVDQFFKDTFEEELRDNPESATAIGRHEYDDRWSDYSKAGRELRHEHMQHRLDQLQKFKGSQLSPQQDLSVRLLDYDLRGQLESEDLQTHLLRVGQLFGFHNRMYQVFDRMPGRTVRDYENIIARIRAIPVYVDQNIGVLNESIARGMMQPKTVSDLVTEQLSAQIAQTPDKTAVLSAFRRFPSNIPATDQQRLLSQGTDAYEHAFLPAWKKLHDFMADTYSKHVRPTDSISSMPHGHEAYAILVRRLTTTRMTPKEIHELGEQEVARIEKDMNAVVKETGFNGSLEEFQKHVTDDPNLHFKTKDEMLIYCRNVAKIIEPELPNQFKHIPELLYGVRAIPPDREAATATHAQAPPPDYSAPGWFNLNTYEPEKQVKYDKEALVLHEAVPGHIFQITLAQSLQSLPEIRRFYLNSAYAEGWALYVEALGANFGLYKDPYNRFGQLASERFRAVRLVVDTGIHELGWTRQQAIDYFHVHAPEETTAEIDRYISWPGQALSYKIGQLTIMRLRHEAEKELGAKFDVRDFHDAVLRNGILPMELLDEQVKGYIMAAAARSHGAHIAGE